MSRADFLTRASEDFYRQVTCLQTTGGDPVDLTGFGVRLLIRGGSVDVEYDDDANVSIEDATAGEIGITLGGATLAAWRDTGRTIFGYSLFLDQPGPTVDEILHGYISVDDEVTE